MRILDTSRVMMEGRVNLILLIATAFAIVVNQSPICNAQLLPHQATYQDYYCGWDWGEAHVSEKKNEIYLKTFVYTHLMNISYTYAYA